MPKPKIICMVGSSKFCDVMAVCGWLIERDEGKIVVGLHLLPNWYPNVPADHLAEAEGVVVRMNDLHRRKIDIADEIFVVNFENYIGEDSIKEVEYTEKCGKKIRWFSHDPIGRNVLEIIKEFERKLKAQGRMKGGG